MNRRDRDTYGQLSQIIRESEKHMKTQIDLATLVRRRNIEDCCIDWEHEPIPIYFIQDCIVVETKTDRSYTYRLINYVSGEEKYLFHRKQAAKGSDFMKLIPKFKELDIYESHYPQTGEDLIRFIFGVIFKLYGYAIRKDQINLSVEMYDAMVKDKISLSDVPVGLGKTHAYLVAAIVYGKLHRDILNRRHPIIITTSSIELQRAIVKDYLPEISRMLYRFKIISKPITSVVRKGKDNYLCNIRYKSYMKNIVHGKKPLNQLKALKAIEVLDIMDLDEVENLSKYDRKRINVNVDECQYCTKKATCPYQQFMQQAKRPLYDIQVCNHNYYLADVIRRSNLQSPLLPDHKVVVMDEAHKIIEAARQLYGTSVEEQLLYRLAKKCDYIGVRGRDNAKNLSALGQDLWKNAQGLFDELVRNIPRTIIEDDIEKYQTFLTSLARVYLSKMIASLEEIERVVKRYDSKYAYELMRMSNSLKVFLGSDIIYWLEQPYMNKQRMLKSIPINLRDELENDLWQQRGAKILTSGTLAVKNSFDYVKDQVGIRNQKARLQHITKESPFDFKKNCVVHLSTGIPYPDVDSQDYIHTVGDRLVELIHASNGHAMVLFTSYRPLKLVFDYVKDRLEDYELIQMSRGTRSGIDRFKATRNGVIFATGSAWEGVNIPGDLLSHLIVVKLPFPIPDPILEYEKMVYLNMDTYINEVIIPQMLIKLRQGVGRLIRTEADSGVISILDSRCMKNTKYYKAVIEALPECRLVGNIDEISTFFEMNKDRNYFD